MSRARHACATRVATLARDGASGAQAQQRRRDVTSRSPRSLACTVCASARVSTCRSTREMPASPAARARNRPRSCAANESAGAMPAAAPQATVAIERYCGASAKRARFSAACSMTSRLRRSNRPRPTSRNDVRRSAVPVAQAARYRRDVTGVATNYTVLEPVADDPAEPLIDVRGGAARRYAAQYRDRRGRGACFGHVADAHAYGERLCRRRHAAGADACVRAALR